MPVSDEERRAMLRAAAARADEVPRSFDVHDVMRAPRRRRARSATVGLHRAGWRRLAVAAFAAAVLVAGGAAVLAGGGHGAAPSGPPTSPSSASSPVTSTSTTGPTTTTTATSTTMPSARPALISVSSVACADATHCWAGATAGRAGDESVILASADGGATWEVQDLLPGVSSIGSVACPSDTTCMVAAERVVSGQPPLLLSTTDGGATWSTRTMPGMFELDSISCVDGLECFLVGAERANDGDVIMATTDGGRTWVVRNRSSISVSMAVSYGISCASAADCVVVGIGALTTTDGGVTWQKHAVPTELNDVSCPSKNLCVAEEDVTSAVPRNESTTIAVSTDAGASWRDIGTVGGDVGVLGSLSCPTTLSCVSVGDGYTPSGPPANPRYTYWGATLRSRDGGRTWSLGETALASNLYGVSCASGTTDCVAVGTTGGGTAGVILRSVDGGATWAAATMPG